MAKRTARKQTSAARARSLAGQKGAAKRAAISAWNHLSPKERKGKTKSSFVTRSTAARLAARNRKPAKRDQPTTRQRRRITDAGRHVPQPRSVRIPKRRRRAPEPEPRKREPRKRSKYAVSADYRSRKAGSAVTIQIAATGPARATKAEAITATEHKINSGKSPKGWKIRIVNWRGAEWEGEAVTPDARVAEAWQTLSGPLALADLEVSPLGDRET